MSELALEDIESTWDLNVVVDTLCRRSSLRSISIKSHNFPEWPRLSRDSLTKLFAPENLLETLNLNRLHLAPSLPDFIIQLGDEPNTKLRHLRLEQNLLDENCGMAIAYLLSTNQTLQELRLAYNVLSDGCGSAIARALSNNRSLKILDLTSNGFALASSKAFANFLESNTSRLENLSLAQNKLSSFGCSQIFSALSKNTTLKSLSMAGTQAHEPGQLVVLANALMNNHTLERLNLAENRLCDSACSDIAAALISNTSLLALNLFGNRIGNSGVLQLAEALKNNSTLEQLNLASNHRLGTEAYKALEDMLEANLSLKHLWMPTILPNSLIPSYIKLNKLGRKRLAQEMDNSKLWIEALWK